MPSLPEGSDIFQRVLQEICDPCENCKKELDGENNMGHSGDCDRLEVTSAVNNSACKCRGKTNKDIYKLLNIQRKQCHVQWADELDNVPLAYQSDEKHSARIYMKTVPKSILKSKKNTCEILVS